jgi:hypothetical protein
MYVNLFFRFHENKSDWKYRPVANILSTDKKTRAQRSVCTLALTPQDKPTSSDGGETTNPE